MRYLQLLLISLLSLCLNAQTVTKTVYVDFGPDDGTNGNATSMNAATGEVWNSVINPTQPMANGILSSSGADCAWNIFPASAFSTNGINHGGLLAPSADLLGEFAIPTVTQDYFFTRDSAKITINNLDGTKEHRFTFFGTRNNTQTRQTSYSIDGQAGQSVTLTTSGGGVGANGYNGNNNTTVSLTVPAGQTELTLTVKRTAGDFAYLGGLKVEELEGDPFVPVTSITITGDDISENGGSIQLRATIEPADATFQTVTWSVEDPFKATIDENGVLTAIENGIIVVYAVSTQPGTRVSAQIELQISNQTARSFYLDCGTDAAPSPAPDENGIHWNNSTQPFGSAAPIPMIDGSGMASDVVLTIGKAMSARAADAGGLLDPDQTTIGPLGLAEATQDFFFTSNSGILTFSGLDPDRGYRFHLFGSRARDVAQTTQYDASGLNGSSVDLQTSGPGLGANGFNGNTSNIAITELVKPDETGTINLRVVDALGGAGYINALRMLEYDNFDICPQRDEVGITVIGSSVARGQGAPMDMGYAFRLNNLLRDRFDDDASPNDYTFENVSIGGQNTVNVLDRFGSDVVDNCGRYVVIGLSLANEGIRNGGQRIYDQFQDNMTTLINRSRAAGLTPIIVSNYPRGDYDAEDYQFIKDINQWIYTRDVPSVNVLGPVDNGAGRWISNLQDDIGHPNDLGHRAFFKAFVPSMFDALDRGKTPPVYVPSPGVEVARTELDYRVEDDLESWTLSFDYRATEGPTNFTFVPDTDAGPLGELNITGEGITVKPSFSNGLTAMIDVQDGQNHTITVTYQTWLTQLRLYVDGELAGEVSEDDFVVQSFSVAGTSGDFTDATIKDLLFYRAPLNPEEVLLLHQDTLLNGSLELYSPLNDPASEMNLKFTNLALSTGAAGGQYLVDTKNPIVTAAGIGLVVSPNPTTNLVSVELADGLELISASLLSMGGQELQRTTDTLFEVHDLPAGTYLVRVVTDRGEATASFIKR
ncbi:GDSL-type esterase/lipase family protein [Lewinella sp. 4G2]|uniref:GDSL-type esterase/lipase family protein n=1 Tax=Lewinella sp. 4G2 TaxID=1803372 RepID=UPI0007B484D1|nr:GDSL-type esterase/lipase family protein [Lewinella sp. 4G2]OAV44883.1 hypothetical protein A3850_010440 [Lewinella sp. 4G2]